VALGQEPFPRGVRRLSGYDDVYRLRVGRYRILYSTEKRRLVIIILKSDTTRTSIASHLLPPLTREEMYGDRSAAATGRPARTRHRELWYEYGASITWRRD